MVPGLQGAFTEAIEKVQAMDRHSQRAPTVEAFDSDGIGDSIFTAVKTACLGGGIATGASE